MKYAKPKTIAQTYEITALTLQHWAQRGLVDYRRTPSGKYIYSVEDIDRIFNTKKPRSKCIYARVSSRKQSGDLQRQIDDLMAAYPGYIVYKDIASGLNWSRPRFQALLEKIMCGEIEEVVVAHKDRLCRFGFELIGQVCAHYDTKLLVHSKENQSQQEELAEDLLSIVNVFVARNNGRRGGQNKKIRAEKSRCDKVQVETESEPEDQTQQLDEISEMDV